MTVPKTMNAVVFKEPGVIVLEERPRPRIEKPTDAVVKVRMAALCGRYVTVDIPFIDSNPDTS